MDALSLPGKQGWGGGRRGGVEGGGMERKGGGVEGERWGEIGDGKG